MKRPAFYQETLSPGETLLYRARLSWWPLVGACLSTTVVALMIQFLMSSIPALSTNIWTDSLGLGVTATIANLIVFGFVLFRSINLLKLLVFLLTTEYAITDQRLLIKVGWISRHTDEVLFRQMESISPRQGIIERLLSYGTVVVSGTGGNGLYLLHVRHPYRFRQAASVIRQRLEASPGTSLPSLLVSPR